VTVVNLLQLAVIGWGGIAAGWVIYMLANGGPPRHEINEPTSGPASWLGYMPFTFSWVYYAFTGAVLLAVVVFVTVRPALRFTPTRKGWDMWRTTPGFLTVIAVLFAGSMGWAIGHFTPLTTIENPYLIGPVLAGVAALVALAVFLRERATAPPPEPVRGARRVPPRPRRKAPKRG
jgi:hypothetical protein